MFCGPDGNCANRKSAGTECTYSMNGDDFCAMGTYCPDMPDAKCMKQLKYGEVCDYMKYMGMDCAMGLYCDSMGSGRCMNVVKGEEPCWTHAACGWDAACGMLTPDENECIQCEMSMGFSKSSGSTLSISPVLSLGLISAVLVMSGFALHERSGYQEV